MRLKNLDTSSTQGRRDCKHKWPIVQHCIQSIRHITPAPSVRYSYVSVSCATCFHLSLVDCPSCRRTSQPLTESRATHYRMKVSHTVTVAMTTTILHSLCICVGLQNIHSQWTRQPSSALQRSGVLKIYALKKMHEKQKKNTAITTWHDSKRYATPDVAWLSRLSIWKVIFGGFVLSVLHTEATVFRI